jgi:hypothetical protein
MTRQRIALLLAFSFVALLAIGRVLLEVGVALVGGNVHTALLDVPTDWVLIGLFALWVLAVTFAVSSIERPRSRKVGHVMRRHGRSSIVGAARPPDEIKITWLAIALLPFVISCSSCAEAQRQAKAVGHDIVNCMTDEASKLDKQFGPLVDKVLQLSTQNDGGIDWPTVKDATKQMVTDTSKCVLARSVARLMHAAPAGSDAPQSSALEVDQERLQSAWRQLADGVTYHTPDGDI